MHPNALLSGHFRVRELFQDGPEPDRLELYLGRVLCTRVLEVLRDIAQDPLTVTDGRRLFQTHERYRAMGLHPSPTSDHAYGAGFLQAGEAGRTSLRVYPGPWFVGVGAADVKPLFRGQRRHWTPQEFEEARRRLVDDPEEPLVGQIIYYPRRGHLHVSNPRRVLLSAQASGALGLPAKRGPAYVYPE